MEVKAEAITSSSRPGWEYSRALHWSKTKNDHDHKLKCSSGFIVLILHFFFFFTYLLPDPILSLFWDMVLLHSPCWSQICNSFASAHWDWDYRNESSHLTPICIFSGCLVIPTHIFKKLFSMRGRFRIYSYISSGLSEFFCL